MNAEVLLHRLQGVRPTGHGRWIARCPAHADRTPSLSIRRADDEAILIHCHAGCDPSSITAAIRLNLADLFPARLPDVHSSRPRASALAPLIATFERDLLIVHILLCDIAAGKAIAEQDRIAAKACAGRLWDALVRARDVV